MHIILILIANREINDLLALVDFLGVDVVHPHRIGRRETETLEFSYRA